MPRYTIDYVDTCRVEYLCDHHNRPGEWLVGVPCSNDHDDPVALFLDLLESEHDECPDTSDCAFEALARAALVGVDFTLPEGIALDDGACVWVLVRELPSQAVTH